MRTWLGLASILALMMSSAQSAETRALPDPLTLANGERVTSARTWREKRRPALLELFRTHIYGRAPVGRPAGLTFTVKSVTPGLMEGKATRKQIVIAFEGPGGKGAIDLLLFIPTGASRPVPAFLLLNNRGPNNIDPTREMKSPFWPAEEIVARGYAAAAISVGQVDPDEDDGFRNGVHGIFDRQRAADSWGTIAAWAWGASRALDYLETDPDIDAKRVAVIGHSRGGKTALWAGAEDERFALVISNDSGSTGAAIARGKKGETIARINRSFPHWFNENYKKYGDREEALPVDQHELLALIAPRPVYVASATEDAWADPESEFLSCVMAEPVYKLFGLTGVGTDRMPAPETPLHGGSIAYHLRTGGHNLTLYDWSRFLDYADKHLRRDGAVFVSRARLDTLRQRIARKAEPTYGAWQKVKTEADAQLDRAPRVPPVWYVPGFYTDAEGHRAAKGSLQDDANAAYTLALAYRVTGEEKYARSAARLIDAWAGLRELKRENDSTLSFSYHFPALIFAADLIEDWSGWPAERQQAFRRFVREKALPMNTMDRANNWGNWGLVLVLAAAAYLDDQAIFQRGVARWKEFIAEQIAPDGHLTHEVGRNNGKGDYGIWYSHFSLLPQTIAAEIARVNGVDLYDYAAPNGRTLRQAFERLSPWALHPAAFPYFKGNDPSKLHSTDYVGYFEILNARWPNAAAMEMLRKHRPLSPSHSAPHLTFTHGEPL